MRTIGLLKAKQNLSDLVDRASRGEKIGITRRGKLAAIIGPVQVAVDLDRLFEDMERIRRRAKHLRGTSVRALIEKGRV